MNLYSDEIMMMLKKFEEELRKYTPEEMAEKYAEEIINSPEVQNPITNFQALVAIDTALEKLSALLIEKGILEKSEWEDIELECNAKAQAGIDEQLSKVKSVQKAVWLKGFENIKSEMDGEKN